MQTYDDLDVLALLWMLMCFLSMVIAIIAVWLFRTRKQPMAVYRRRRWWLV
jgi:hypothetical protein